MKATKYEVWVLEGRLPYFYNMRSMHPSAFLAMRARILYLGQGAAAVEVVYPGEPTFTQAQCVVRA